MTADTQAVTEPGGEPHKISVGKRFFSSTLLNYMGQGFILILTFVTAPYTVHHLGPELYGILALVQVTAGFAGLLNLGIGRALTKYVSELHWRGDIKEINELFQTAWGTCVICGAVGIAALVIPKGAIASSFFRGGKEVDAVVDFAIYVAAFGLFTSMLLEAITALPAALQRFGVSNFINMIVGVVRCVGPVVVLYLGYSIRAVLLVTLASNILAVIIFAVVSRSIIPGLNLLPKFHWEAFQKLFRFSLPLLLSAFFALIITRVDRFILAYYLPLAAVTFYTLPYSISEKASMGVANITSVVFPFTSELHSRGAHDKVHELYLRSTKILIMVTLPITVILLCVPNLILRYWLGAEYAAQGTTVLWLLGATTFLTSIGSIATVTSLGVGDAWIPAVFAFASSMINLISNLVLIPLYGINGAALAAMLPQALVNPVFVFIVTRKIKFPMSELLTNAFLRPLFCGAIQAAILLVFRSYATNLITLGLLCVASLAVYGLLSLFMTVTSAERRALLRLPSPGLS